MGVGEGGTVGEGVGRALFRRLATSNVGVAAAEGSESPLPNTFSTKSTVAAETATLMSKNGKNCRQVGRRTLPTAADHSIGGSLAVPNTAFTPP